LDTEADKQRDKKEASKQVDLPKPEYIQRFGLQFRIQHIVLFTTTIALVITGIPMWCLGKPGYSWSQGVVQAFGSIEIIRFIHRVAGVGLIAVSVYHLFYTISTRQGRREFIELLPRLKDVTDLVKNILYFIGLRKERPSFDRFTYFEKFDYWAVYWGCVIMIGSGLVLWFDRFYEVHFSWFPYELAAEIHADEAILAAVVLFTWHFYNVHLNPSRFPYSGLWWHGRISREEMMREHPLEYEKWLRENKS